MSGSTRSNVQECRQSLEFANWFKYEFWRFVFVQDVVAKFGQSFVEFPPMQKPASFNLEAVKEQIMKAISAHGKWRRGPIVPAS